MRVPTYDMIAAAIEVLKEAVGARVHDVVRCDGDVGMAISDYVVAMDHPEGAAVLVGRLPTDITERSAAESPLRRAVQLHATAIVRRSDGPGDGPLGLGSIRLLDDLTDSIEDAFDHAQQDAAGVDLYARVPGGGHFVLQGVDALETGLSDYYARAVRVDMRRS